MTSEKAFEKAFNYVYVTGVAATLALLVYVLRH